MIKPPDHLLPNNTAGKPVDIEHLFVDTGLTKDEVAEIVTIGDLISFAQEPVELDGGILVGHSLDNRASVAALTYCLQELQTLQASMGCLGCRIRTGRNNLRRRLHIGV